MPLKPGAPVGETIKEFKTGKTYAHTLSKFGPERARKQAIAVAIHNAEKRAEGGRVSKPVGFVENPAGVPFHCPSCKFYSAGKCDNKDPRIHGKRVTTRHCCNFFKHDGMKVLAE